MLDKPSLAINRTQKSTKEMSLVPMINVIFLLLIYFIIAGTIGKIDILPIDPPEAESGKVLDEGHVIILLGRYQELVIDDELVSKEDVVSVIQKELKNYPNKIITLKADGAVKAHDLIEIMDLVRAAGGVNLSLVTQSPM